MFGFRTRPIFYAALLLISLIGAIGYWWFFGWYRFANISVEDSLALASTDFSQPVDALLRAGGCENSLRLHSLELEGHPTGELIVADNCRLVTRSPWMVDENHAWPFGYGVLNVLMFVRSRSYVQQHGLSDFKYDNTAVPLSFIGRELYARYEVKGFDDGSSLHFWVQGSGNGKRLTNHFHGVPLVAGAEGIHESVIDIGDASQYRCLGATARKAKMYGRDQSADEVLRDVNVDFGYVRLVNSGIKEGRPGAEFVILGMTIR